MKFSELYRMLFDGLTPLCGEAAHYEARELAEAVTRTEHGRFAMMLTQEAPISKDEAALAEMYLSRRRQKEPLAYILGYTDFYGRRFRVGPACLIPRDDTEVVCERMLRLLPAGARLADIGTGSGAIALTALCERQDITAVGYDISQGALAVAAENAERLSVSGRFTAVRQDALAPDFLEGEMFDLIVSNPPYIPTEAVEALEAEVRREPHIALDGGEDGLLFYRRLLDVCPSHIRRGGHLLFEIGYDQGQALCELCGERGLSCEIFRDFGGNDRGTVISL